MAEDRPLSPNEIRRIVSSIQAYREHDQPFDVAFGFPGLAGNQLTELLPAYAGAGVTWWLECSSWKQGLREVRQRIDQRPPSL